MVLWRKRTWIEIVLGVLLARRLLGQIKEKTSPTIINTLRVCLSVCRSDVLSVGLSAPPSVTVCQKRVVGHIFFDEYHFSLLVAVILV